MAKGRKTGGRGKGTPNKATAEIREHAQQYTIEALEGLALIARNSTSDAARVSAWNALLDRGWGKPILGVDLGLEVAITGIERRIIDVTPGVVGIDHLEGEAAEVIEAKPGEVEPIVTNLLPKNVDPDLNAN